MQNIINAFKRIGAEAVMEHEDLPNSRILNRPAAVVVNPLTIDVRTRGGVERFELKTFGSDEIDISILDVQPQKRHLLMMLKGANGRKDKFLCGHDETHWFVSGMTKSNVSTVAQAIESLKPDEVRKHQVGIKAHKKADTHKNRSRIGKIIRQGEWYFIPTPNAPVDERLILRNEKLQRNARSKPHIVQELYRSGGSTVYVYLGQQLTAAQHSRLSAEEKKKPWRPMRANAVMYGRGTVKHPDHSTVHLPCWCKIELNAEAGAAGAMGIRYLD